MAPSKPPEKVSISAVASQLPLLLKASSLACPMPHSCWSLQKHQWVCAQTLASAASDCPISFWCTTWQRTPNKCGQTWSLIGVPFTRRWKEEMKPFEISFSCKVYKILSGLSSLYKTLFFVAFYRLDFTHFTLLVLYWWTFCSFPYIFPELFVFVECCPIAQPPRVWYMKLLRLYSYLPTPTYCPFLAAGENSIPSRRLSLFCLWYSVLCLEFPYPLESPRPSEEALAAAPIYLRPTNAQQVSLTAIQSPRALSSHTWLLLSTWTSRERNLWHKLQVTFTLTVSF